MWTSKATREMMKTNRIMEPNKRSDRIHRVERSKASTMMRKNAVSKRSAQVERESNTITVNTNPAKSRVLGSRFFITFHCFVADAGD